MPFLCHRYSRALPKLVAEIQNTASSRPKQSPAPRLSETAVRSQTSHTLGLAEALARGSVNEAASLEQNPITKLPGLSYTKKKDLPSLQHLCLFHRLVPDHTGNTMSPYLLLDAPKCRLDSCGPLIGLSSSRVPASNLITLRAQP